MQNVKGTVEWTKFNIWVSPRHAKLSDVINFKGFKASRSNPNSRLMT